VLFVIVKFLDMNCDGVSKRPAGHGQILDITSQSIVQSEPTCRPILNSTPNSRDQATQPKKKSRSPAHRLSSSHPLHSYEALGLNSKDTINRSPLFLEKMQTNNNMQISKGEIRPRSLSGNKPPVYLWEILWVHIMGTHYKPHPLEIR
jgi:hypothetical protein